MHQDPHPRLPAAGLARLKLELCPPIPPGPSPCRASPVVDSLWGHLPFRTQGIQRWAGSTHRTARPGRRGVSRGRGALRGLPLPEAPWHLRQHAPERWAPRWACGAAGQDGPEGGRVQTQCHRQCTGTGPPGSRLPASPSRRSSQGDRADPAHAPTGPGSRPHRAPVASQSARPQDSPPRRPGLGTPAGRRD